MAPRCDEIANAQASGPIRLRCAPAAV